MADMKGIEPSTTDRQSVMITISPHTQLMQLSSYFFIQAPCYLDILLAVGKIYSLYTV